MQDNLDQSERVDIKEAIEEYEESDGEEIPLDPENPYTIEKIVEKDENDLRMEELEQSYFNAGNSDSDDELDNYEFNFEHIDKIYEDLKREEEILNGKQSKGKKEQK